MRLFLSFMQVFPYHIPVKNLLVVRESGQLIVLSEQEVSAIALHRCHLANNSCGDCVALQDPYCAWHIRSNTCQPFRPGQNEQLQNVNIGFHPQCPVPIGMYFISEPLFCVLLRRHSLSVCCYPSMRRCDLGVLWWRGLMLWMVTVVSQGTTPDRKSGPFPNSFAFFMRKIDLLQVF